MYSGVDAGTARSNDHQCHCALCPQQVQRWSLLHGHSHYHNHNHYHNYNNHNNIYIDTTAPFALNSRLLPLMVSQRSKERGGEGGGEDGGQGEVHMPRFIVNVSAMEVCHARAVYVIGIIIHYLFIIMYYWYWKQKIDMPRFILNVSAIEVCHVRVVCVHKMETHTLVLIVWILPHPLFPACRANFTVTRPRITPTQTWPRLRSI